MTNVDELQQQQQNQAHIDEQACGERISYYLKKFGCDLVPICELRAGQVQMRVDIVKLPPDVLRQLRKTEREAQSGEGTTP